MLIYNATVHTMEGPPVENGWVLFEDGVVTEVGGAGSLPDTEGSFDAGGGHVTPGLIDAHSHIGMLEAGLTFEGDDSNEMTDPCTPHLRAIDAVNPMDCCFGEALRAGVTTVVTGPGSANAVGGQAIAMYTSGSRVDDMVIAAPCAVKFALGENPKFVYNDKSQSPMTRMATAAIIREQLFKSREYLEKCEKVSFDEDAEYPEFDIKCEALIPVLKREVQAHFHAHRADDIFTAIRIAKEFDLDFVIVHGTEAHLVPEIISREGARVITGPSMNERTKPELKNQSFTGPKILADAGVLFSICTDHPETSQRYLALCAALAVKDGLSEYDALAAITINSARLLGLDGRIGSIAVGKSADIAVFTAHPLDFNSRVNAVFIQGKPVYTQGEGI